MDLYNQRFWHMWSLNCRLISRTSSLNISYFISVSEFLTSTKSRTAYGYMYICHGFWGAGHTEIVHIVTIFVTVKRLIPGNKYPTAAVFHKPCVNYWVGILIFFRLPSKIIVGGFMSITVIFGQTPVRCLTHARWA